MKLHQYKGARTRMESHPSRGAWIEIVRLVGVLVHTCVAPLTGCVD